jgi:hypothetical protein
MSSVELFTLPYFGRETLEGREGSGAGLGGGVGRGISAYVAWGTVLLPNHDCA